MAVDDTGGPGPEEDPRATDERAEGPRATDERTEEPRGTDEAAPTPTRTGRSVTVPFAAAVVTAVIVVALLAACGFLGYQVWEGNRQTELRHSAQEEAARLVEQLATYDHTDVDANLEAVVAEATPDFGDRYREVSDGLRELLSTGEGASNGRVTHAAVESVDAERAVVLVFLDQDVSNVTVPEGRTDSSRMVVTLHRDGDRWLLDDAQLA